MAQLANFPLQSQLAEKVEASDPDGRSENARYNCVATSIAASCHWLTGVWHSGDRLKDDVYGEQYANAGTAAKSYIGEVAKLYLPKHVALWSVKAASQAALIGAIRVQIKAGHPTLITMPSAWNTPPRDPLHPGSSHVGAVYQIDDSNDGYMTVMNPWGGFADKRRIATWQKLLCYNECWPMSVSGGGTIMVGVPSGWRDDGVTLHAPNGVSVVKGFRNFILKEGWEVDDWPLAAEYASASIEPGNPSIGAGSRQDFRKGSLGWTERMGVYRIWVGQDLAAYRQQLAEAVAQIKALQAKLATGDAADAAMHALKLALAAQA